MNSPTCVGALIGSGSGNGIDCSNKTSATICCQYYELNPGAIKTMWMDLWWYIYYAGTPCH